jgi:hypothetical protein
MHEPVVVAEDPVVAAIATDLRRRMMVAETVELDDQPLDEVHVVGSDPMNEDVDRVGLGGVCPLAVDDPVALEPAPGRGEPGVELGDGGAHSFAAGDAAFAEGQQRRRS